MPVVFFKIPVDNPDNDTPLIFVTVAVKAPVLPVAVTSPPILIV